MNTIIGIDLGTTYCAVAYVNQHGQYEIIPNREGERTTPSVVLFDGDTPIVGTIAKQSAVASPLNVCQFVKRQMGERDWQFVAENDKKYSAEEISALILRRLKEDAETALQHEVTDAVITVPAYFNDAQRRATQDAGAIAGLNVLRIVNEPTAAALAYGLGKSEEQTIMVYDLGGGTFDVTIMKISKNSIEVIATGGDKNLGGFNWDNEVMEFLNKKFQEAGGIDLNDDLALVQDLRDKAEIAKKTLSSKDKTQTHLWATGKSASVSISREEFEGITVDLLNRTGSLMELTLEDANLDWSQIDKILLVGGSTRMKSVAALVEKVSGKTASAELHPDEIVAGGAALLAGIIQKELGTSSRNLDELPAVKISDVNSHSLGTIALDCETGKLYNSIVLQKDTPVLTQASKVYGTVTHNQSEVEIEVTEGEEESLDFVRILGKGSMRLPPYPQGAPIEVIFQYDLDGIIHVDVFDKTAGKKIGEIDIKRESNRSVAEINKMKANIQGLKIQ